MAAANGRLMKELTEVGKDDSSGVNAKPKTEGNLRHLLGSINGPPGTVYEGGIFEIDITIPKQYPFEPPKMKFITKVWHPNISSQTGAICLVRSYCDFCLAFGFSSLMSIFIFHCVFPGSCAGYSERPVESRTDNQNSTFIFAGSHVQS